MASFHTRVSRIILEDGKRKLSGETVTTAPGRQWFLSPHFHRDGEWWPLSLPVSVSVLRKGPTWVQIRLPVQTLWMEPWGYGYAAAASSRIFRAKTWFSYRGERVKYLLTLFWPELKAWFLQCASFLPLNRLCAFHWQCLKAPRSSREFTAKLIQTLSSQVPHDHLSSNASQEATAPADTEAWLGSSPLYLLLKILLLPFLSCRIEVPRASVGTAESRGRADQVGITAVLPAPRRACERPLSSVFWKLVQSPSMLTFVYSAANSKATWKSFLYLCANWG